MEFRYLCTTTLGHNLIEDICEDDNHYLWVHMSKFSLDIGTFYKPERTNVSNFLNKYTIQLQKMKRTVVYEDFNFDLLKPNNSTRNYINMYKECNFRIINKLNEKYCTRETQRTTHVLNHVWSSLKFLQFPFCHRKFSNVRP